MIESLFCDGGVVGSNPSPKGCTWAWCAVSELGVLLNQSSGVLTPEDIGLDLCTNNVSELYASVRALESVPRDWNGRLYTDSKVTWHRLMGSESFNGIPKWLEKKVLKLRTGCWWKAVVVKGHATREQLEQGWAKGLPVSKWNSHCDSMCQRRAKEFLLERNLS